MNYIFYLPMVQESLGRHETNTSIYLRRLLLREMQETSFLGSEKGNSSNTVGYVSADVFYLSSLHMIQETSDFSAWVDEFAVL